MSGRVRIGTCANSADAALVRSVFSARGIGVVIGAEHHASLFAPLGASFLSLDIWVASEDAEEAAALLRDLREAKAPGPGSEAARPEGEHDDENDDDEEDLERERKVRSEQKRRTALAILLGCFVTFGTAHMVTGAWARGIVLAVIELVGIRHLVHGERIGTAIVLAAVVTDLVGGLWRLRAEPNLPVARLRRP